MTVTAHRKWFWCRCVEERLCEGGSALSRSCVRALLVGTSSRCELSCLLAFHTQSLFLSVSGFAWFAIRARLSGSQSQDIVQALQLNNAWFRLAQRGVCARKLSAELSEGDTTEITSLTVPHNNDIVSFALLDISIACVVLYVSLDVKVFDF